MKKGLLINTQLLFTLLLLFSMAIHAMDVDPQPSQSCQILVLHNAELIQLITDQIYRVSAWKPEAIGPTIHNLSTTDKTLYSYCTDEVFSKNLVRKIALHNKTNDLYVARFFPYRKIQNTVYDLFKIARTPGKSFTPTDLQDPWYLTATRYPYSEYLCSEGYKRDVNQTLLLAAIQSLDLEKVKVLIKAKIDCDSPRCENPIALMTSMSYQALPKHKKRNFYAITRLLIDHGINPDSRTKVSRPTLLQQATTFGNQGFARSLLKRGANPNLLLVDFCALNWSNPQNQRTLTKAEKKYPVDSLLMKKNKKAPWLKNAFLLECGEPKGWLAALVAELKENQNSKPIKKRSTKNTKDIAWIKQ